MKEMINEDVTPTYYDLARPHSTRYIYDARDGEIKADWPVDNKYVELYSAKDFAIFLVICGKIDAFPVVSLKCNADRNLIMVCYPYKSGVIKFFLLTLQTA